MGKENSLSSVDTLKPNDGPPEDQKNWLMVLDIEARALHHPIMVQRAPDFKDGRWLFCDDIGRGFIHARTILPNELVFDFDTEDWLIVKEEGDKLLKFMDGQDIPYLLTYTGGKGIHVHVFFDINALGLPPELLPGREGRSKTGVDTFNELRVWLYKNIVKAANVDGKRAKLDATRYKWGADKSGQLIRELGCVRIDGGRKVILPSIPDHRPSTGEYPVWFPDDVKLWDPGVLSQSALEELAKKDKKVKKESLSVNAITSPLMAFPCYRYIMENGAPKGHRHNGALTLALMNRYKGRSEAEAAEDIKTFTKVSFEPSPEQEVENLETLSNIYKSDMGWSCVLIRDAFEKSCNKSWCPLCQAPKVEGKDEQLEKDIPSRIVEIALNGEENTLFHDDYGDPYIRARQNGHWEIMPINGSLGKWLSYQYWKKYNKVPGSDGINSALTVLKGRAIHEGEQYSLHVRVAEHDGAFWYYLSDEQRRAIRIDGNGWNIVEPPILFKHYAHMLPQDEPERSTRGGHLDDFLKLLNLKKTDRDFFKVMLVVDLVPGIPQIGLNLTGQQGSCKTTAMKLEKMLIDPSSVVVVSKIKDEDELIRIFAKHHIVAFDNVSRIPGDIGDLFCQAITGGAMTTRAKYTDDDDFIRSFKIILRLNGISNEARKSDLLERLIILDLDRIKDDERRSEEEIWSDFYTDRKYVLAELLDLLSEAIRKKKDMARSTAPRMADWFHWGEAVGMAMGHEREWFREKFKTYEDRQDNEAIEQSILATLIEEIVRVGEPFIGTATDLLSALKNQADMDGINTKVREWPSDGVVLGKRLTPLIPNLEKNGIHVERIRYDKLSMEQEEDLGNRDPNRIYRPQDRIVVIERPPEQDKNKPGSEKKATCSGKPDANFKQMNR
ncbi:MAG: hypothetical protein GXX95_00900 [Methanomassiliicoccus sp.]|nr:hypothetical protein [Methanomassiliicoccus sp.]